MQQRQFGATGVTVSRLGFGCMRLPTTEVGDKRVVDDDLSIAMIHAALDRGVTYVDTALFYCDGQSEVVVGKALQGRRSEVSLSTKYPVSNDKSLREVLETQLGKLATDHIDFYHLHGIGAWFLTHEKRDAILADAAKAKDEGLIRHLSFSFHDKPEAMAQIIDLGVFSSVLCQYNLLDRANEEALANARSKGLGTVVMGPVGGGRIAGLPAEEVAKAGVSVQSSAELALRFVFANPNVDCAISGMSTMEHVIENTAIAARTDTLTDAERSGINAMMEENKRLADLYCTGCNYCGPHCPEEINIPHIFQAMNYLRVYGLKEFAFSHYNAIGGRWVKGKKADWCRECGECETHCPQKIEIRRQLKECLEVFGASP
jgi:predicted aldo/keto reductase-like oxidoreductase